MIALNRRGTAAKGVDGKPPAAVQNAESLYIAISLLTSFHGRHALKSTIRVNGPISLIRPLLSLFASSFCHPICSALPDIILPRSTRLLPRTTSVMAEKLLSTGIRHESMPQNYIRPESERPRLSEVETDQNIPLIDMNNPDESQFIKQIDEACQSYGFFQVVNHGIANELIGSMRKIALEFFRLPVEEKMSLYSDNPAKKMRLSTSFNIQKETVHNWRDYLRLHCYPLEEYVPGWPSNPPLFKDVVSNYCREVRKLGFRLLGKISLSLGLEEDYIEKVLGEQEQHMAINFYPPCPEPELTYGLPAHTDPNALTVLLQDQQVAGLQVLKDGKWIAVSPHPDAFVINLGDQLQALSNGRYRSVWHRAVVNSDVERMSVASFLAPCNSAVIKPAEKLTGEGCQAVYRSFTYDEYYKKFWSRNLDQDHCLELFKTS